MGIESVIAILAAILGPVAGIVTGVLLDRRNKRTADQTTRVAAREAATHEFEAITAGYTDYTTKLEARASRADSLEKRIEVVEKNLRLILAHLERVETLVPAGSLPPRPTLVKLEEEE